MKSVFKYLMDLNYANTVVLVALSILTILLQSLVSFGNYITAFLLLVMFIVALLSPVTRFKSVIFGKSRILFLTPKPYSSILKGYLLSEAIIFITYYIGISICLFSLEGQVDIINYFFNMHEFKNDFLCYSLFMFIKIVDIWFSFTAIGVISVVLSRKHVSKKIRFLSTKIFIRFVAVQFIMIFFVEIMGVIMLESITRSIISVYILYLSYIDIKGLDIY